VVQRRGAEFPDTAEPGVAVTWLGHSTLLLDVDGHRVLIDPVWGERASPFSFMGPRRFFAPPLPLQELPRVDAIVISHDHYDHLDTPTVVALSKRDLRWVVPLGVGAHLEYWGVPPERITELDWWESTKVRELTLTATPARHFSGRSVAFTDADCTLWSGWSIASPAHRVFYSGDTAMFDGFIEIGRRLGPFELTMLEVGAYDRLWRDVHLGPEQAVRAHRLVRGKVFLPVHWGLFDLALHGFTEPVERVLVAARAEGVDAIAPRPGETVRLDRRKPLERWWPDVPWVPVAKHDARSSGVEHLLGPQLPPGVEP
jgi:L-ascorbate metabolism protein UlaG (beta-lactamase superfamily)